MQYCGLLFQSVCALYECAEVDECALGIDMCEQSCINTFPGFMCGCNVGFTLNEDGALCDGIVIMLVYPSNNIARTSMYPCTFRELNVIQFLDF